MSWLWLLACTGAGDPTDTEATDTDVAAMADAGIDREVEVGSALTLDIGTSTGTHFTWDFGDGTDADGSSVSHTWEEPGHYQVVLTAWADDGTRRSDALTVTAYLPPAELRPVHSSTIAVDDAGRVWVVTPEAGALTRIEDQTATVFEVCTDPTQLAIDGARIGVTCPDDDLVVWVDADGVEVDRQAFDTGSRPLGIVGRDDRWYVALAGTGELWTGTDTVAVGPDLRGLALGTDRVYLTRFRSAQDQASLFVYDGSEVSTVALGVDTRGDSDTTTGGVPNLLGQVVLSPDEGTVYLPSLHANVVRGEYRTGEGLDFETAVRAIVAFVDTDGLTESVSEREQLDERGYTVAAEPSELGDLLYLLHPGAGAVTVLSAYSHDVRGSILEVGEGANGLAIDGDTLYVHAWLDRTVHAYDVTNLSTLPTPSWSVSTVEEEPLDADVLLGKQLFYSADERMAKSGYIACAHCHPDGDQDGLVWDFTDRGEGLRNTSSMQGRAGTGMGPVHWSGNFDEIQDFENDIRNHFSGSGLLDDADWDETEDPLGTEKAGRSELLDALAAYVTTLDTTPSSPYPTSEAGAERFASQGCESCHPAPLYTDSALDTFTRHDVGTLTEASGSRLGEPLDGLDTPTLLGAWATPPYLHDGSAETLEDAIAAHDGVDLDEDDLTALADFVRGL